MHACIWALDFMDPLSESGSLQDCFSCPAGSAAISMSICVRFACHFSWCQWLPPTNDTWKQKTFPQTYHHWATGPCWSTYLPGYSGYLGHSRPRAQLYRLTEGRSNEGQPWRILGPLVRPGSWWGHSVVTDGDLSGLGNRGSAPLDALGN